MKKNAVSIWMLSLFWAFYFNPSAALAQWTYSGSNGYGFNITAGDGACDYPACKVFETDWFLNLPGQSGVDSAFNDIAPAHYFRAQAGVPFNASIRIIHPNIDQLYEFESRWGYDGASNPWDVLVNADLSDFSDCNPPPPVNMKCAILNFYDVVFPQGTKRAWLSINIQASSNHYFQVIVPVVVEGYVPEPGYPAGEVPILGTTTQPQMPYLVLHAPPGDGSSSEFQDTKTTCRESSTSAQEDNSGSANLAVKIGVAGSIGLIATVNFEFSVTINAGVTGGAMSMTQTTNQTCVTVNEGFQTTELTGPDGGGDVFIGYGTDLEYGVYRNLTIDPNTCAAHIDTGLVYTPVGEPRKFVYTKNAILSDIALQQSVMNDTTLSVRARNNAKNQVDVWNKVLALNDDNVNNPNNASLGNISFSSGTSSSQESSITITDTKSIDYEQYIETSTGLETVVEVGGSGISGGFEYRNSRRYGQSENQSQEAAKVLRYTLADDDSGDVFNLDVVRDPMFGTPIFRIAPGTKSSCPYQGGYQRDQPKLKHSDSASDHITLLGNPVGSSATFNVDLCNESNEERTYNLKLNAQSNLNGAVVSAAGVPLNGNDLGQSFTIPANSCVQDLVIEVKQLSANSPLSYPDLELFLYSPCDEDIQSSVFASVYFGNASGVNDLADNNLLQVSPNPASGLLQVSLPDDKAIEAIRIADVSGKVLRNIEPNGASSRQELDVSSFPQGLYILQARSGGQVFVKKVVVE